MTRALDPLPTLPTVAGGLALALMLSACGGGDDAEQEPNSAAAEADGEQEEQEEQDVELVDPMQLAPDNLCEVLSDDTLADLVADDGSYAGNQDGASGRPDENTLETSGELRMSCITVSTEIDPARSHSLTYSLDISEEPHMDDEHMPPLEEGEDDPSLDLGDQAVSEISEDGSTADITAVDGQVLVEVQYDTTEVVGDGEGDYTGEAYLEQDELLDLTVGVVEEIFAEVDSNR